MPYSNPVESGEPVQTFDHYANNGDLMSRLQAWRPQMFEGRGLDATYGSGVFWKYDRPGGLETNGGTPTNPADHNHDFRAFPADWDKTFDWVVYDGPYRLSGTSDHPFCVRFGLVDIPVSDRMQILIDGAVGCAHLVAPGGSLMIKCQDQVVSGARVFQTEILARKLEPLGFRKRDEFHGIFGGVASNPRGGKDHAAQVTSTLVLLERKPTGSKSCKWPVWKGGGLVG